MQFFEYCVLFFLFLSILVGLMLVSILKQVAEKMTNDNITINPFVSVANDVSDYQGSYEEAWEGDPNPEKRIETVRN